ncbi:hypothetical protein CYMTET_25030 [Cymbomonas tetramitiformis]|uniref:P-type ATPase C-terminal domain-containing protein n=1 Tax=Cymbomonas tetramitiformis TaxID=36881 RepID=A0AAE0KZB5_9CHLO|nr:hypothetical protein CYMTET_25030 [Cymbomonas tetramitiformis]
MRSSVFNQRTFWWCLLDATYQGAVLCLVPLAVYARSSNGGLWTAGTLQMAAVTVAANTQLAMDLQHWTWITAAIFGISIALYAAWSLAYDGLPGVAIALGSLEGRNMVIYHVAVTAEFWLGLPLAVSMGMIPRFIAHALRTHFAPSAVQLQRESDLKAQRQSKRGSFERL